MFKLLLSIVSYSLGPAAVTGLRTYKVTWQRAVSEILARLSAALKWSPNNAFGRTVTCHNQSRYVAVQARDHAIIRRYYHSTAWDKSRY